MSLTSIEIEIANPQELDRTQTLEFLVDSGAYYSVIPEPVLQKLGIESMETHEFQLADGTKLARKMGGCLFRYEGKIGGADIIFGEEGDCTILGALALASLGYFLDPFKRTLKPMPLDSSHSSQSST